MTQEQALDILKLGHNAFLTGPAGSGKTYLLNKYIEYLEENGAKVGITASTGIAATHMNGLTIHSWSGMGIKEILSDKDLRDMAKKHRLKKRFKDTSVLIIDEISMLHNFQLDMVNRICQHFRHTPEPFGGIQVILCGDFFQLPPISKGGGDKQFVFGSDIWSNMDLKICYLQEQHRQADSRLIKILNGVRANAIDDEIMGHLQSRRQVATDQKQSTKLYTHNIDVDKINQRELDKLPGDIKCYTMRGGGQKKMEETLRKNCLAPEKLCLKKGATVMFVKNNFEEGYVNGTLGKIVDFDVDSFPIVEIVSGEQIVAQPTTWIIAEDDKILAEIKQIPLRLAWAITVHKSQGMSLDSVEMDLSKSFERGMGYVALSRARSLDGIKLLGFNAMALMVNEDILGKDEELKEMSQNAIGDLEIFNNSEIKKNQKLYLDIIAPDGKPIKKEKKSTKSTYQQTRELIEQKMTLEEIVEHRGIVYSTVLGHLEKLLGDNANLDLKYLKPKADRLQKIQSAFDQADGLALAPVREILGKDFHWDELRLARLFITHSD